ncbi:MAG TPA: ATP-binding protein, partial [Pyrinomonadaceae bacterium]|nr:ATP-binding protein [Pyrinomonadaceae bacterium]
LAQSQQSGSEYNEQFRVIYSDARIEWISARGKTFLDTDGNPEKMMGVVRKITEQKTAENELSKIYDREKQARDEAVEANRAKDFFLAFVSHELRSPLNAILGWSKILLTKKVDEEMQKNALETIERSARSQAKLINDLVDSARIASGKLRLEFIPVNLFEIIRTVYNSQKPVAESKEISLELSSEREEIPIFGDANRLQQVFNNLVSNALKFTPSGGKISLQVQTSNNAVKVLISDTGQGIDAEALPDIFRQFSQGSGETIADKGGLGLGLSIVKILVEKHNGKVTAESEGIGKGTTFSVILPLTNEEIPTENEETEVRSDEKPLRGINILLVEDDNDSREVLSLFLNQCGANVSSAESAKTAMEILEKCGENHPNIIISDLAMPIEDGYSLMSRIRQLPNKNCSQIPAIALSAFATNENKQKAYQSGFQKYSTKPFEPDLLISEILSLVKK